MAVVRHAWLVVIALATVVYAISFSDFPVLERRHSILGDSDAAAFVPLLRDFDLATPVGDEYNTNGRTINDVGQKHKIHHLFYAAVGHGIYRIVGWPLRAVGAGERAVLYAVNAVVAAGCLVLLWILLGTVNPHGNSRLPFLVMGAASFSFWLYSAVPESWPFSAFLVLLTLLILAKAWLPWWGTAIWIGIAMLNNMTLAMLLVPLGMQLVARDPTVSRVVLRSAVASVLAFGTWLGSLWFFSIWEPDLRPDHFFGFLVWFRQFVGEPLPPLALYNWKIVTTNLFLTSLVSNQGDPYVPANAILLTFQQSWLGIVATLAVALLLGLVAWRVIRAVAGAKGATFARWLAGEPVLMAAVYLLVDFVVILLMYPGATILYSSAIVLLYPVLACRYLDLRRRNEALLMAAVVLLMVVNNTDQMLTFRRALSAIVS